MSLPQLQRISGWIYFSFERIKLDLYLWAEWQNKILILSNLTFNTRLSMIDAQFILIKEKKKRSTRGEKEFPLFA